MLNETEKKQWFIATWEKRELYLNSVLTMRGNQRGEMKAGNVCNKALAVVVSQQYIFHTIYLVHLLIFLNQVSQKLNSRWERLLWQKCTHEKLKNSPEGLPFQISYETELQVLWQFSHIGGWVCLSQKHLPG